MENQLGRKELIKKETSYYTLNSIESKSLKVCVLGWFVDSDI